MPEIVVCWKPVPYHYALRLLDVRRFTLYSFGNTPLMLLVSAPIPPVEEVCTHVESLVPGRVINEEQRMQRSSHLPERRRPWSATRTKAPLWDRVSREARSQNLKEYFLLAEEIVAVLGRPWESSKRGRKPLYSPEKLAAMLIVKEAANLSFERLHAEAEAMGYDARTDQAKEKDGEVHGVPCPSQLHWAMAKIPEEYLKKALRLLDHMVTQMYVGLFGDENLEEYSVDSTEDTCTILEEAQVAMRTVLQHQTVRYNILTRLATNTVRAVDAPPSKNTRDARNLLEQVPPSSVVYMDREYDVEYNYQHAHEREVTLIVCPKLYPGKTLQGTLSPPGSEELRRGEVPPPQTYGEAHRKQGC